VGPGAAGGARPAGPPRGCCDRHHTLLHNGFRAEGDADGEVTFFRPDGSVIGTTTPAGRSPVLAAM
jgi:hypothetical protein